MSMWRTLLAHVELWLAGFSGYTLSLYADSSAILLVLNANVPTHLLKHFTLVIRGRATTMLLWVPGFLVGLVDALWTYFGLRLLHSVGA
jgi:hypothetical protein